MSRRFEKRPRAKEGMFNAVADISLSYREKAQPYCDACTPFAEGIVMMMKQDQFHAIMPYISADLVAEISRRQNLPPEDAVRKLYTSTLYAALEQEETKVWQYSTQMLYALLEQEEQTGSIQFPDV